MVSTGGGGGGPEPSAVVAAPSPVPPPPVMYSDHPNDNHIIIIIIISHMTVYIEHHRVNKGERKDNNKYTTLNKMKTQTNKNNSSLSACKKTASIVLKIIKNDVYNYKTEHKLLRFKFRHAPSAAASLFFFCSISSSAVRSALKKMRALLSE